LCYEISSHLAGEIRKLDGFATDWSEAKKNIYKHSAKAWESSISRQTGIANEIKSDINLLENLDGIINDIDMRNEQLNDNYSPKKAKNLKKETEKILNLYEKCQKKPGAYLVVAKNHLAQLEVIISYSDGLPSLYKNAAKIIERHKSCIDAISKLDAREREVRGEISFLEHKLSDMGDDSHLKRILEEKLSQLGDVRGITATINGAINPAYNGLAGKGAQYPASVGKPYIFTKKVPLVGQDTSFGQDKIDAFIEKLKEKFPNFGEDGKYCNQAGNFEKALRAIGEAYAENGFKLTLNSVCEIQGLAKKCHIQDIPGGRKVIRVGIDSTLKYRLLLDCTDAESPMIIFVGNKGDSKNYIKNRGYMNASNDGLFELLKNE
jgi:hypothetical protein